MAASIPPKVITWDYQFAPNAQKARNLLNACGIPYQNCEQPFTQPRPILTDLGITYRRIPVNSIGKDFYCDNRIFLQAVQSIFPDKALPTSPADHAFDALGYRSFWLALPLVSTTLITPELAKEREDLFAIFSRPDFGELKPNSLAEFKQLIDGFEKDALVPGPWLGGAKCSVADIHAIWIIKWAFQTLDLGSEPGFSRDDFPKVYKWIEGLAEHNVQNQPDKLSGEEAKKIVLGAEYAAKDIGVDDTDPLGLKAGTNVAVETNDDAKPGNRQQCGKLKGLGRREIVIELDNGIRVHFPRIGFLVKQA